VVPSVVLGEGLAFTSSGFEATTLRAVRLGGRDEVTKSHLAWEQTRSVSHIPSFLYAKPWLFTVHEAGVAMCLKAANGEIGWQQRLEGAFSASPVWVAGRIYLLSETGETIVLEAGPEFKALARNALDEKCQASPAVSAGRIFIRGESNLYCIREAAAR
jgi:outer membrane protein assembly factor BamB